MGRASEGRDGEYKKFLETIGNKQRREVAWEQGVITAAITRQRSENIERRSSEQIFLRACPAQHYSALQLLNRLAEFYTTMFPGAIN